jgi:hypothetical protein
MKIKYAIFGSDTNPLYLDFWPIVSKIWSDLFNVTPVLGLICDEDSDFYNDKFGLVKKFKKNENIPIGMQSQCVRLYLSTILKDVCIISDIDMIPMSKKYFIENIDGFDNDKIYVMSSDHYECNANKEIQMCYNIGHSDTFEKFFKLNGNWEEFINKLHSDNCSQNLPNDMIWTTDQRFLYTKFKIDNEGNEQIVYKNRGFSWSGFADFRIDRGSWRYDENLVGKDYYIDSHLLRPYQQHKSEIDNLIKILYSGINNRK